MAVMQVNREVIRNLGVQLPTSVTMTIMDDGFPQAVQLPLALRVLNFRLKKDPNKHFTAYNYDLLNFPPEFFKLDSVYKTAAEQAAWRGSRPAARQVGDRGQVRG